MDTRELLKKVRQIEIKTRGLVNQIFSGEYHSVFKGRGMEFSEVREYQYGDDIRSIDWNVSARFNHPFVKIFEEERELTVMLVVDFSRSGTVRHRAQAMKNEIATEICAVLAFSAIKNNDKVGLILFTDHDRKVRPAEERARAHPPHHPRTALLSAERDTAPTSAAALEYFNHVHKKRTIAFLISDFIDDGYDQILRIISRKHDVIAVELSDPREEVLPDAGLVKLRDAESGSERWVDTVATSSVRAAFVQYWKERKAKRQAACSCAARWMRFPMRIDRPYIKPIVDFFKLRERRL